MHKHIYPNCRRPRFKGFSRPGRRMRSIFDNNHLSGLSCPLHSELFDSTSLAQHSKTWNNETRRITDYSFFPAELYFVAVLSASSQDAGCFSAAAVLHKTPASHVGCNPRIYESLHYPLGSARECTRGLYCLGAFSTPARCSRASTTQTGSSCWSQNPCS